MYLPGSLSSTRTFSSERPHGGFTGSDVSALVSRLHFEPWCYQNQTRWTTSLVSLTLFRNELPPKSCDFILFMNFFCSVILLDLYIEKLWFLQVKSFFFWCFSSLELSIVSSTLTKTSVPAKEWQPRSMILPPPCSTLLVIQSSSWTRPSDDPELFLHETFWNGGWCSSDLNTFSSLLLGDLFVTFSQKSSPGHRPNWRRTPDKSHVEPDQNVLQRCCRPHPWCFSWSNFCTSQNPVILTERVNKHLQMCLLWPLTLCPKSNHLRSLLFYLRINSSLWLHRRTMKTWSCEE